MTTVIDFKAIRERRTHKTTIGNLKAEMVTESISKDVVGPCFIEDEEGTVRAEGICCLEHGQVMAAAPELLAALKALFENCAMPHKYWGENSNQKEANAAIAAGLAAIKTADGRQA